jgi:hypothetical protein
MDLGWVGVGTVCGRVWGGMGQDGCTVGVWGVCHGVWWIWVGLGLGWGGVGIRLGVFVVDSCMLGTGFLYNICTGSKTICTYVREPLSTEILFL